MLGKSRSGNSTGSTIVQENDRLGEIAFCGADGNDIDSFGAAIKSWVDGTPGNNNMPGRLVFYTTPSGQTAQERLVIKGNGNVGIGTEIPQTKFEVSSATGTRIRARHTNVGGARDAGFDIWSDDSGTFAARASLVHSGSGGKQLYMHRINLIYTVTKQILHYTFKEMVMSVSELIIHLVYFIPMLLVELKDLILNQLLVIVS